jgi:hypothetical protein
MSNMRAEGVIEALTKDGKGFLIDGQWYKCFTPAMMKATKGDFVSFSYKQVEKDGRTYNNVSGVVSGSGGSGTVPNSGTVSKVAGVGPTQTRDPLMLPVLLTRERAIIRQSSLAQAVNYGNYGEGTQANKVMSVDDIIRVAREFEAYASGDLDIENAKKSLNNEDLDGAND